jgi:hypothetical protein
VGTLAIEINDAGLVVADADSVLAVEPGYALLVRGGVVTGDQALRQARLKPRHVSNRYWSELSAESGSGGLPGVDSAAELAYSQLSSLWERFRERGREVALVVPGHYDTTQLGLLLGLARECEMPVRVMVNAAAAASYQPWPGCQLIYADAGLHRLSVTALEQAEGAAVIDEQGVEGLGLAQFSDRLAKRVAELFVIATRFDPFHRADSEQQLYDSLPQWLATLESEGVAELSLSDGGETISIQVEREHLLGAADAFHHALVQLISQYRQAAPRMVIQLSHRLAALSGVVSRLRELDHTHVVALDPGQAARGALVGLAAAIDQANGQVRLLRQLGWRLPPADLPGATTAASEARSREVAPSPTHVVYQGVAYPVSPSGLVIGREIVNGHKGIVMDDETGGVSAQHCELVLRDGVMKLIDLSREGTFVNNRRVLRETRLAPADRIRLGSSAHELQVIRMEHGDGT